MASLLQVHTLSPLHFPSSHRFLVRPSAFPSRPMTPLRVSRVKPSESLSADADTEDVPLAGHRVPLGGGATESTPPHGGDGGEGISGIYVPRQKYISVSKTDLLDAILSTFESEDEAREFALFARCLDSVLHAENKTLLEEMRAYRSVSCLCETDEVEKPLSSLRQPKLDGFAQKMEINSREVDGKGTRSDAFSQLDIVNIFGESLGSASEHSWNMSRVAAATHFQQAFLKLLRGAQFEEISAQDLLLARALNTDYLLTLPIYVDWKKALQSNAVIFRRGYTAEGQKGMLLVEKLDYLQSNLLQGFFSLFSKPVKEMGIRISEVLKQSNQTKEIQDWIERVKTWLAESYLPQNMLSYAENRYINLSKNNEVADNSFPIGLAAQKAVPLYEGILSYVGPRGRLMRKLLAWIGLTPSVPEMSLKLSNDNNNTEAYLRPTFLNRITLSDIWKPATKESCGNNLWKIFKTSLSIIFSQSYLQEPAFQELILLYTEDMKHGKSSDKDMFLPLQLKIYERIPIPDLPVIFPHKKLSFRILDTIRLDAASILGLLAFLVNYKFETVISSPSAFLLDLIAISALIIYATRVGLGYKQTWDRYQLLVNKTLYEKTLASGFGSVHFLLDASEQQQYKEAILAFAVLQYKTHQVHCRRSIKDTCERFLYTKFKKRVEMPIDNAIETLLKLKIVTEHSSKEKSIIEALSPTKARDALKNRWDTLLAHEG